MKASKPRVAVIGTGGSISTPGRHSLDLFEYSDYGRTVEVDELLALFPEADEVADIVPVRFRAIISPAITPEDWIELAANIGALVRSDSALDGIVITHGTSTAEETAYFLHLVLKVEIPVIVVGAQRPPNGLSSDAGLNLINALRVASSPACRGLGVLVVLNDEIHSAREVTKTSNFRLQSFQSPEFGVLGHADADGTVTIYRRPVRRHTVNSEFDVSHIDRLPRVDVIYSYAGADGQLILSAVEAGAEGVVIAALAPGILTPGQREAVVKTVRRGSLVVMSNRGGVGRMIPRARDVELGIVAGDNLNPQKCRVLGILALSMTENREEIRRMFLQY